MLCSGLQADSSPKPLTPDYGGPVVSYADGVFDSRFSRFVTVREGHFFFNRFFFVMAFLFH